MMRVLKISPAISSAKRMVPKHSITYWRKLTILQLTFSATASITRHTPSTTKNTMALLRLVMRMGRSQNNSTSVGEREKTGGGRTVILTLSAAKGEGSMYFQVQCIDPSRPEGRSG